MEFLKPAPAAATSMAVLSAACLFVVFLTTAWAGALTPNYSHVSQFISELGASGAPYEYAVRMAGFLSTGVLLIAFCLTAFKVLPRTPSVTFGLLGLALFAAGYLAAVVYPCDAGCRPAQPSTSQLIHNAVGLIGYMVAPAFLFALARAARSWPGASGLSVAGYVASVIALFGFITLSPDSPVVGLSQRALEFAVLGWVTMLGSYVMRQSRV